MSWWDGGGVVSGREFTITDFSSFYLGSRCTRGSTIAVTVDKCFVINAVDLSLRYRD